MLRLWDWINGKQLRTVDIYSAVQPFIVVDVPKKKRGWKEGDGAKGKRRHRKNKAKLEETQHDDDGDAEDDRGSAVPQEQAGEVPTVGERVFVVHKMASIPSLPQMIVFSVVG